MSSSGLIYAVIVGAWAAYLVPMWLRRQDELNEARPTERFSTAIRLLSGRAAMERRYTKDLQARSADQDEPPGDPDGFTGSVDVRALAVPTTRREPRPADEAQADPVAEQAEPVAKASKKTKGRKPAGQDTERGTAARPGERSARPSPAQRTAAARQAPGPSVSARYESGQSALQHRPAPEDAAAGHPVAGAAASSDAVPAHQVPSARPSPARRAAAEEAAARARRSKVLARRRRTTVVLFVAFTLGAVVAAVGGLTLLWAPGVPAVLLSAYIAYLRAQERRRFTYTMDRRQAEVAAQRLRERQPRRRQSAAGSSAHAGTAADDQADADDPPAPADGTEPPSALTADRRALVEQTDHAEWVDQQRERQRGPAHGGSWEPVPVPLPTYVTAPVAPRAGGDLDLGAPDTWSSARSSAAEPPARDAAARGRAGSAGTDVRDRGGSGSGREGEARRTGDGSGATAGSADDDQDDAVDDRCDARRAASARRARERGRTPLFDQYAEGDRPRAAGQ